VETLTLETMKYFARHRLLEPVMVNLSGCGDKQKDYEAAGLEVVSLGRGNPNATKTHHFPTLARLRRFFLHHRPDIIHTMLFPANYFGRLAALGLNIPVINHIHNIVGSNSGWRHRFINRRLSHFTSLYISVSFMVRAYTQRSLNAARRPSIVIYNGTDLAAVRAAEAHDLEKMYGLKPGPVIVQAGRMAKAKNFDLTIAAFKIVQSQIPSARLLLIGSGPEEQHLRELARAAGPDIVFTGYRPDILSFFKSCQVLAVPSAYEGFPMVHVEAMACGLPAVLSPYVPSREMAAECSLICQLTPQALADSLIRLLGDQELYQAMSRQARQSAEQLSIESHCASLLKVYHMLLAGEPFGETRY
jgi:glycosyltransferase involved in cell wall biosynthesis